MFLKDNYKKILLFILAIIFIFSSISGVFYATGRFNIIKTTEKNIHINDFIKFLNRERNRQYVEYIQNKQDVDIEYIKSKTFTTLVLEKMLYTTLVENEVDFYGIQEPMDLVVKKVVEDDNMKNELGKFDIYKFQNFLKQSQITENKFLNIIKTEDEKSFLSILYSQNSFEMPDIFVNKTIDFYNVDKGVYVITKNIKDTKHSGDFNITDEEIKDYYNNNKQQFLVPKKTKISYIDFGTSVDSLKIDDYIKDKSKVMTDIAKNFNRKVVELDFTEDSKLLETYKFLINGTVLNEIGFTSSSVKVGNRIYVYHIDDIRQQEYKTEQQARNEIIEIFKENTLINSVINEANKIIQPMISNNGENIILTDDNIKTIKNAGFSIKKSIFNLDTINNFNQNLSQQLVYLKVNQFTSVVFDRDSKQVLFAVVDTITKNKNNKKNLTKDYIVQNFNHLINISLQENYLSYLKNKYKAKISEKLLGYITDSEN